MAGKIEGAGVAYHPSPLVSISVYGQPNTSPGHLPYPNVTPTQTPGAPGLAIPGQANIGVPFK